ncbi:MAG: hypothetical protein V2B20_10570 [Pseudomonadota bacterium]
MVISPNGETSTDPKRCKDEVSAKYCRILTLLGADGKKGVSFLVKQGA